MSQSNPQAVADDSMYSFLSDPDFARLVPPGEPIQAGDYYEIFANNPTSIVEGSSFIGDTGRLFLKVAGRPARVWRKLPLEENVLRGYGGRPLTADEIAAEEWVMAQERRFS